MVINSREQLKNTRALVRLNMLANYNKIGQAPDIGEIPKNRTRFPNTKEDYWYSVDLEDMISTNRYGNDYTACVYELGKGSIFFPHYHEHHTEQLIILTEGAKLEVVTDKYEKTLDFPNSIFFDKKEPHSVINKNDFPIKILVIWSPKMKVWDASFIKEKLEDVI